MTNEIMLTFDLEFFKHGRGFKESSLTEEEISKYDIFKKGIEKLFFLLDKYDSNATFFVVSEIAMENPEVVEKLVESGHEIASHSKKHLIRGEEGVKKSKNSKRILEKVSGQKILGYRAPGLQAEEEFIRELGEIGFEYDSSLIPSIRIPGWYSGKFIKKNVVRRMKGYRKGKIFEIPPSVNPYFRIPISSFFFRLFPFKYIEWSINSLLRRNVKPIIYLHPWEFVNLSSLKEVPWRTRIGTGNKLVDKVEKLLSKSYQSKTILEIYQEKKSRNL